MILTYVVSILVLVDVPLKLYRKKGSRLGLECFNPCFGGCSIKTLIPIAFQRSVVDVSILVLVDVPLKRDWDLVFNFDEDFRFNPCFGGCSIKTSRNPHFGGFLLLVSILVLVDVPLKP